MKQRRGWWCVVVACIFWACGTQDDEGGQGGNGAKGSPSTIEEGALLIVEVMADPQGVDTEKEWIEIHNPTDTPLSLEGLELFVTPDTTGKEKRFALPSLEMLPGAYLTLGDNHSGMLPPHVDIGYDRALGALPNTSATVGLRKIGGALIDSMHYSSTKTGRSLSRHCMHVDSQKCVKEEALWCFAETDTRYDGENFGSPQKPNAACKKDTARKPDDPDNPGNPDNPGDPDNPGEPQEGTCLENGAARHIRVPQPGQLLLNELMMNPRDLEDRDAEWVELWALAEVDLNNLVLATRSASQKIVSENCIPVKAGEYVLLARSAEPETNGCLPKVDWLQTLLLPNNATVANPLSLTLSVEDNLLDSVSYPTVQTGRSYQRDPHTQAWCYVPTSTSPYDTCPEGKNNNRGTPKNENVSCP